MGWDSLVEFTRGKWLAGGPSSTEGASGFSEVPLPFSHSCSCKGPSRCTVSPGWTFFGLSVQSLSGTYRNFLLSPQGKAFNVFINHIADKTHVFQTGTEHSKANKVKIWPNKWTEVLLESREGYGNIKGCSVASLLVPLLICFRQVRNLGDRWQHILRFVHGQLSDLWVESWGVFLKDWFVSCLHF